MQRRQGFLDCSGQLHVLTFRLRLSLLLCLLLLALFLLLCRLSLMSLSQLFLVCKTLARLLLLLLELLPVWLFKPVAQGLIILEEVPDLCQRPVCNPPAALPSESLRVPIGVTTFLPPKIPAKKLSFSSMSGNTGKSFRSNLGKSAGLLKQ